MSGRTWLLGLLAVLAPACALEAMGTGEAASAASSGGSAGAGGEGGSLPAASVQCGEATCAPGEICCVTKQNDPTAQACGAPAACGGVVAACDGPEDCPNQVCCGDFDETTSLYTEISCQSLCDNSPAQPIMCNYPDGPCPASLMCIQSSHLPAGFGRCGT